MERCAILLTQTKTLFCIACTGYTRITEASMTQDTPSHMAARSMSRQLPCNAQTYSGMWHCVNDKTSPMVWLQPGTAWHSQMASQSGVPCSSKKPCPGCGPCTCRWPSTNMNTTTCQSLRCNCTYCVSFTTCQQHGHGQPTEQATVSYVTRQLTSIAAYKT